MLRPEIELAIAEAKLGNTALAASALDGMLRRYEAGIGPLLLGTIHAARAKVALWAGDAVAHVRHRNLMERHFRSTGNPALIAECARAAVEADATSGGLAPGAAGSTDGKNAVTQLVSTVASQCATPTRRAERLLELVVELSGASAGYLFLNGDEGLKCAAQTVSEALPPPISETLQRSVAVYVGPSSGSDAAETRDEERDPSSTVTLSEYEIFVLPEQSNGAVLGAVAFRVTGGPLSTVTWELLRSIATHFSEPAAHHVSDSNARPA
jgi:hypothetical protein